MERQDLPSRKRVTAEQIRAIAEPCFSGSVALTRAIESQEYLQRKRKAYNPIPETDPRWSVLDTQLSGQLTGVLRVTQKLAERRPHVIRYATGTALSEDERATAVEVPINAIMDRLYPWRKTIGALIQQSYCAVTTLPSAASWRSVPDLYEDAAEERIAKQFRRNKRGKRPADYEIEAEYGADDLDASREAYAAYRREYRAQRLPLEIEAFGRTSCRVLNPRLEGDRWSIDGLVTRQQFSRQKLKRYYSWGEDTALESAAQGGEVTLWGLWAIDDDSGPYVAYSVDGKQTQRLGEDGKPAADALTDLGDDFGLACLPVAFEYGWWLDHEDPEQRPVPFPWVFGSGWMTLGMHVNTLIYQGVEGLGGRLYKPDPESAKVWGSQSAPPIVQPKFGMYTPMPGDPVVWPTPNMSGTDKVISLLGAMIENDEPSKTAYGGTGAGSAIERTVIGRDTMSQFDDHKQAALRLFARTAEHVLEITTKMAERYDAVVVAANQPIIRPDGSGRPARNLIEIKADLAGEPGVAVYDLTAEIPRKWGDNMAEVQQAAELKLKNLITMRHYLEIAGFEAPEVVEAQIEAEKLGNLPMMQARRLANAARYAGDIETAEFAEAFAAGKVDEMGSPIAAQQGVGGPPGMGEGAGAMTGTSIVNPVQSQLASIASGQGQISQQMQQDAAGAAPAVQRP